MKHESESDASYFGSVSTPEVDRIIVDYFGLNTLSLLANTPPFAHNNQLFNSTMNHGKS